MDYPMAQRQADQIQQQSRDLLQKIQDLAQRLRGDAKDDATGRELAMDLREIALAVQSSQQTALAMIQQMAQYIQLLEQQLQTHPQPTVQPRGWYQPGSGIGGGMGGGFLGSLVSGLGLGAGFGIAEDAVNDIFNAL